MNFRIVETPSGSLLVYRDQNEVDRPTLVFQMYSDGVIFKMTLGMKSVEAVQEAIETSPPESFNQAAEKMMATLINPSTLLDHV